MYDLSFGKNIFRCSCGDILFALGFALGFCTWAPGGECGDMGYGIWEFKKHIIGHGVLASLFFSFRFVSFRSFSFHFRFCI